MKNETKEKKSSLFNRILNGIETAGNKLPHPITLFAILAFIVILVSGLCSLLGVSAILDVSDGTEPVIYTAVSLLSGEGLVYILTNAVKNFTAFAPLGVVLVTMLGVGCAEGSGYISALLIKAVDSTPKKLITPMLVFLGVMSNVASDVGYVVLIPLGAMIFMACKRHPIAGLAAAFAGVSGGFSANLIIGTLDPMLASISTEAAQLIDPAYVVNPADNYIFLFVSTFLVVIVGTFITNKIVEPRLGVYGGEAVGETLKLDETQKKALKWANIALFVYVLIVVALIIPSNGILRNPETGSIISNSPFIDGLIVLVALLFFIPSVVYGRMSGKWKGEKDICAQLGENMASMGGYIALAFFAAQFISYFGYTNLGTILAVNGANFLANTGLSGPVLMVLFVLFTAFINLFMGSASAKWTLLAPIFIPMFMLMDIDPQLTQVAYRIGDSCTNIITPLMSYFAMIVVYAKKYDKDSGIGTLISTMIPYSIAFLISWTLLLVTWMLTGLPLGL